MILKYCVQLPDFSTEEDHDPVNFQEALEIIKRADWDAMNKEEKAIEESEGEDSP